MTGKGHYTYSSYCNLSLKNFFNWRAHVRAIKVAIDKGSNLCGSMEITIATEPNPPLVIHQHNSNIHGEWKGGKEKNIHSR